jgi:hypothetical protein
MLTSTLLSNVQKGRWLGASGSAELMGAINLCAAMAVRSKTIESKSFI